MAFTLALPKISLFGAGCVRDIAAQLAAYPQRKPLIVTEAPLVRLGLIDGLVASLKQAGYAPEVFDRVMPNPTDVIAGQGLAYYRERGCDFLIGFGGGSSIDTAKALRALLACPGKSVHAFEGIGKVGRCGPLLVAVSTTSGTAAEVTSNAVIIDSARHVKMVLIDPALIPEIAVNDPELMLGLPAPVTAATGMDALTHAIEAYVSVGAHPMTDPTALEAIRVISRNLPRAVENGRDLAAREQMAHGQFLAGMAFNSAGLGYVHSLAHQPGATHNLPHGVCNAILLPIVCEFNRQACAQRFADIAAAMGVDTSRLSVDEASRKAIEQIRTLSRQVGIPSGLGELGVSEDAIAGWIAPAQADPCTGCAPVKASDRQLAELYRAAF
jgi:lactaldehyde reductase